MRKLLPALWIATMAAVSPGLAQAQDAPAAAPMQDAAPVPVSQGDQWKAFSRSSARSYLIELNHITRANGVTGVMIARVPLPGVAGNYSHTLVETELRCNAKTSHVVAETDVDPAGVTGERIETGEDFDGYSPNGLAAAIATLVCDNNDPASSPFVSVQAYIDDGRK